MKTLFLVFLFLYSSICPGQNSALHYDEINSLVQQQDFNGAYSKSKTSIASFSQVDDTTQANILYLAAYSCFMLKKYDEALDYCTREIAIREKVQSNNTAVLVNAQYMQAVYSSYLADYQTAIPAMQHVADYAEKQYGKAHVYTLHYNNQLANLYNLAGAYKKAETIYDNNYTITKSAFKPTDSMYQVMVNTVSSFYTSSGNYEKTEPFFIDAVRMQEQAYGKKSENYMASFNSLGELYIYAGMYTKAEQTYREFVLLAEDFYGKNSADYATALNNLAVSLEKQDKNKEAETIYLKCLNIKEKVHTKKSDFYALSLINLGVVYDNMGEYAKAEKYLNEALSIYKDVYGGGSENYATALSNIASVYSSNGKNKEAEKALTEALQVYKALGGENNVSYLTALNNLANVQVQAGNYAQAKTNFENVIVLRSKVQGEMHTDVGVSVFNLANVHTHMGNYSASEKLLLQALSIQHKALGENHTTYANVLQSLADVYTLTGRYQKAEEAYQQCDKLYGKLFGPLHPEYAIFLNNYAHFYFELSDYEKCEALYQKALDINYAAYGQNHPNNIALFSNIANLKTAKNDFKEAERLLLSANNISKQYEGENHANFSTTLNNLAALYAKLGNYEKAETLYQQAMALRKSIYGEKHSEYGISLNNLGTLYLEKATDATSDKAVLDYSLKAIVLFKKALSIDSINTGVSSLDYAAHLNNLGEAYRVRQEWTKAEDMFFQSLAIEEKILNKNNHRSAITLHNIALLYAAQKQYTKAETYALQSYTMFEHAFGKNSHASSSVTASLGNIYHQTGNFKKAETYYGIALLIQHKMLDQNFSFLSEEEKEKYVQSVSVYNNMYNSFAFEACKTNKNIATNVYENEIKYKGSLLRSATRLRNIALNSSNTTVQALFKEWTDTKQQLASLYASPNENKQKQIDTLQEKANQLEKELTTTSAEIKNILDQRNITFTQVQNTLLPAQAGIEFISYTRVNDSGLTSQRMYCALILKKNQAYPDFVELCNESDLQNILLTKQHATAINQLYAADAKLYALVWKPLESYIAPYNELFYAPTGLLNKISFSALRNSQGMYIADQYTLHLVNSTAYIRPPEPLSFTKAEIALFGGVTYANANATVEVWKYLPGTKNEVEKIKNIALKTGMQAKLYTGNDATEENFKALNASASPQILHVATHGFFFGNPEETKKQLVIEEKETVNFRGGSRGTKTLVESSNPLMRSGIVLAGANTIWNEENNAKEDGVITAYEASLMDLRNTKLAILSACETGLGDIKGNEGVYGLQRAFKIAGASTLMMSLWQVPDKETEEFMVLFYGELAKTKNTNKAFAAAQKTMRLKHEPYYWAAFILIE